MVSDQARSCPSCGYPVSDYIEKQEQKRKQEREAELRRQKAEEERKEAERKRSEAAYARLYEIEKELPSMAPDKIAYYADDSDINVRRAVAENLSTPPGTLAKLADDKEKTVRCAVATNKQTPSEVLAKLAKDSESSVRRYAASNESLAAELLAQLAGDRSDQVREGAAGNPSTPPDNLTELAKDWHLKVRRSAARNEKTPPDTLVMLTRDKEESVCNAAFRNPSTPSEALAEAVRQTFATREPLSECQGTYLGVLLSEVDARNNRKRQQLARNPSVPGELLAELAEDSDIGIVLGIAGNVGTPPETLAEIARRADSIKSDGYPWVDKAGDIRKALAKNPSTPPNVLDDLLRFKFSSIYQSLAENPSTSPETLAKLAAAGFRAPQEVKTDSSSAPSGGCCYVATAVYGSYDCPQVWTLRRFRDYVLAETWYGRAFIKAYYAVSPTLVKQFGSTEWFKKICRRWLDNLVDKCQKKGFEDTPYIDRSW